MTYKARFKELGYKLNSRFFKNVDRIYNQPFYLDIDYNKKKIITFDSDDGYVAMSKEFLELLYEYLQEKGFFKDE